MNAIKNNNLNKGFKFNCDKNSKIKIDDKNTIQMAKNLNKYNNKMPFSLTVDLDYNNF